METKLDDANRITKESVELFNELQQGLDTSVGTLIPMLRQYLEEVRNIRMAFGAEVKHIIQSTQEMSAVTKNIKELKELAEILIKIDAALNNGLILKVKSTFNV